MGQLARRAIDVDENIDVAKAFESLSNDASDLVRSSDVELEDERLRGVPLDQVADSFWGPCRDDRSLAARQDRVGQGPPGSGG